MIEQALSGMAAASRQQHDPVQFDHALAEGLAFDIHAFCQQVEGDYRYALVDAGNAGEGWPERFAAEHGWACDSLFSGSAEAVFADIGPWLIELPQALTTEQCHALALQAATRHALSLIASPYPRLPLLANLKTWLDGRLEDGTSVLVRYFDPRIGLDLINQLPEAQAIRQSFACWASWDVDYQPRWLTGNAGAMPMQAGPLLLSRESQRILDEINAPDLILALIHEDDLEAGELDHISPALKRFIAHRQYRHARSLGVCNWADQRLWVIAGLVVHPGLAAHPQVAAGARQALERGMPLASQILDMPEKTLKAIQEDAPRRTYLLGEEILKKLAARIHAGLPAHPFAQGKANHG